MKESTEAKAESKRIQDQDFPTRTLSSDQNQTANPPPHLTAEIRRGKGHKQKQHIYTYKT